MSDDSHEQMHRVLGQRQTSDLLEIWQTNNQQKWSKQAIQVVGEILLERQVELPQQNQAVGEDPYEGLDKLPPPEQAAEQSSILDYPPEPEVTFSPIGRLWHRFLDFWARAGLLHPQEETLSHREYEARVNEENAAKITVGGYEFQIPADQAALEPPSQTDFTDGAPLESNTKPRRVKPSFFDLFFGGGGGGAYRRRPYHRVNRPRTYTSLPRAPRVPRLPSIPKIRMPIRAAPARRSVEKGRRK